MNRNWWIVPLLPLCGFVGWVISNGMQAKRESEAFHEQKTVDLGVLSASDARNRQQALQTLVGILGPGVRYSVKWKTKKSGQWVDYELIVLSRSGLIYCEISEKAMDCFDFAFVKAEVLQKIANNKQSTVDPFQQLEKQGYKMQRTRRLN